MDGLVRELRVIRSVTICRYTQSVNPCEIRSNAAYPLIKRLAFPDKNDVALDKVRIERLQEGEDDVPERRRKTVSKYDTCGRVYAHDQAYPHNGLRLLKLEAPGVESSCASYKYARPAQRKAHIGVEVDLFEEFRAGEELGDTKVKLRHEKKKYYRARV